MRLEVYNDNNNHIINEMTCIGTIEPDNIEIMIFQSEVTNIAFPFSR